MCLMHRGRGLWSSVFSVPRGWKAASVAKLSAINVNSVQLIQAATWMEHFGAERSQVLVFEFAEPSTALHHVSDCDHVRHCLARAPISSTESNYFVVQIVRRVSLLAWHLTLIEINFEIRRIACIKNTWIILLDKPEGFHLK